MPGFPRIPNGFSMPLPTLSTTEISRRLATAAPGPAAPEEMIPGLPGQPKPAAVLLPLFRQQGRWRLLFIRRAVNSRDRHSGEVAFPGGRIERRDSDPAGAALREAREEIGLDGGAVELLGNLAAFRTSSNFLVTPVVGRIPWPLPLQADPTEVARIFSIPLEWLADARNHAVRPWRAPGHPHPRPVAFFDPYDGERLWGVSARITLSLIQCLR